eukprot:m.11616 g.11616  ORF g.11616 m.11616 type:complete len:114 (+) comp7767_c0_seq2:239-580(+)
MPVIPSLDDQREEEDDITKKVAEAPEVAIQISTMADLNRDLVTALPFTQTESGIDLKLLTSVLNSTKDLAEPDEPWEFQQIFTEVKSEIATERDRAAIKEGSTEPVPDPLAVS